LKSEIVFLPPAGFDVRERPAPFVAPGNAHPDTVPDSHGGDRNAAPVLSASRDFARQRARVSLPAK